MSVRWCGRGWCLFASCLLASSVSAQRSDRPRHCVWRVTNVAAPFYLVGSIHTLRGEDYPLAEVYRQALRDSKRLLFEYDPYQRDLLQKKLRAVAKYPPGQDIRSEIRPQTFALLVRNLSTSRLRYDDVKQYRPWAVAMRLLSRRGYVAARQTHGVDQFFSYQARRLGKEVGGLETVSEHVAFWENILRLDGENVLLYAMTRGRRVSELFEATREAWKSGDVAALSATNANLRKKNRGIAQRLLDQRNRRWVPRIEAEMRTGIPTAIVAGAGHFSGENSVVDLLQKRGYKIEQL